MLNLDEFVKTIDTHSITLDGKEYKAKPLSMNQLAKIQALYNESPDDSLKPVKALFTAVGYPADKLLDLPLEAIAEVQKELFLSFTPQVAQKKKPKKKKKS